MPPIKYKRYTPAINGLIIQLMEMRAFHEHRSVPEVCKITILETLSEREFHPGPKKNHFLAEYHKLTKGVIVDFERQIEITGEAMDLVTLRTSNENRSIINTVEVTLLEGLLPVYGDEFYQELGIDRGK